MVTVVSSPTRDSQRRVAAHQLHHDSVDVLRGWVIGVHWVKSDYYRYYYSHVVDAVVVVVVRLSRRVAIRRVNSYRYPIGKRYWPRNVPNASAA